MGDHPEGLKPGGRCCHLIVVNPKALCEALSHIADLVVHDLTRVVMLTLANKFASQGPLASRDI